MHWVVSFKITFIINQSLFKFTLTYLGDTVESTEKYYTDSQPLTQPLELESPVSLPLRAFGEFSV